MEFNTYIVVLEIEDTDRLGPEEIKDVLENEDFPNHCMNPKVVSIADSRFCTVEGDSESDRIINRLIAAMKKSEADECTDHLDCTDDAGAFWYDAIKEAKAFLNRDKE
jgi:hypothetical protein